jgi:hypothetical protein
MKLERGEEREDRWLEIGGRWRKERGLEKGEREIGHRAIEGCDKRGEMVREMGR